jgi:Fic family protein
MIGNKYHMTLESSIFFAKRNIVDLIFKSAQLEGLSVTYPDTYSVVEYGIINGMSFEDALIINNLKHAWQFILSTTDCTPNLTYICQIHKYVGESMPQYNAGFLRNKIIHVTMGDEEPFTPEFLIEADARDEIDRLMLTENATDRAISLMLYLVRRQLFNDGNKRVAMLCANQIMVANGVGVISVPPSKLSGFIGCLVDYFKTGNMSTAKQFVYENCIKGNDEDLIIQVEKNQIPYLKQYTPIS